MPSFVEDPTQFSKERLRAELVARSAPLPSSEARKQVYVELYRRHVGGSRSADFSSDEEEEDARQDGEVKQNIDTEGMDVSQLTDKELKDGLLQYGVQIGPIVATTRALYEKKLLKLQSLPSEPTENNKQYSDSEEEISGPGSEEMGGDTVANIECRQQQEPGEPVDVLTEMFPGIKRTPTGISATCRKPIKGAAGRPVQFRYPDISTSPDSKGQQEVQRHMVPMWVRVLVFLCVVCLLGLIYGLMENPLENPFSSMLESFNHMAQETEEQPAAIAQHDQL